MKRKKLNNAGFTLIELLAVITIMGILMMVAIPSVSRTIENSRRDSFATIAKSYIDAVRNAVNADEFTCGSSSSSTTHISSMPSGGFFIEINSDSEITQDLMESGGSSSWGGSVIKGYIVWYKEKGATDGSNKTTYSAILVDAGGHGIPNLVSEKKIARSTVYSDVTGNTSCDTSTMTCTKDNTASANFSDPITVIDYHGNEIPPVNAAGTTSMTECWLS